MNQNSLRKRFERFCLKHRDLGIRNLMLFVAIGNVAVWVLSAIDPSKAIYGFLCFSRDGILHGQVWRLFTYLLTYMVDLGGLQIILGAITMFCYYQFGKILEQYWGTFRFNLYYLCGLLITDIAALLIGAGATATALNLSLFLAVATIAPEAKVLLFFFIPVKFKYMAWVYLGLTLWNLVSELIAASFLTFQWLMPIIPLLNYFLFFGSDIKVLFPQIQRRTQSKPRPDPNWASSYQSKTGEKPYRHKCTVCGKTDTQYPDLEFRYCSRCQGYHCYCMEHINNHAHIQ